MKMTNWIVALLITGVLGLIACNRAPAVPDAVEIEGVKVALPALQKSLSTSTDKDVQASMGNMAYALRYRDYPKLQAELAKLAANPSLNDAQKKLVATVDEQAKQLAAKTPAPTQ